MKSVIQFFPWGSEAETPVRLRGRVEMDPDAFVRQINREASRRRLMLWSLVMGIVIGWVSLTAVLVWAGWL